MPCQQRQTVGFRAVPKGFAGASRGELVAACFAVWITVSFSTVASHARADEPELDTAADAADAIVAGEESPGLRLQPPPTPAQRGSLFAGELHIQAVLPLADALCPSGESCLLNGGFGIGGSVERRWTFGGALSLGYDLALLDAGGIYEVSTLQTIRVGVKWVVPLDRVLKPYLEIAIGALLFGDTFGLATAGGALQLGVGGELEVTASVSLTGGLVFRGFTTGAFISTSDRVPRGRDPGANLALLLQVGILFMNDPVP